MHGLLRGATVPKHGSHRDETDYEIFELNDVVAKCYIEKASNKDLVALDDQRLDAFKLFNLSEREKLESSQAAPDDRTCIQIKVFQLDITFEFSLLLMDELPVLLSELLFLPDLLGMILGTFPPGLPRDQDNVKGYLSVIMLIIEL